MQQVRVDGTQRSISIIGSPDRIQYDPMDVRNELSGMTFVTAVQVCCFLFDPQEAKRSRAVLPESGQGRISIAAAFADKGGVE